MRSALRCLVLGLCTTSILYAACVGDDPATPAPATPDAGSEAATVPADSGGEPPGDAGPTGACDLEADWLPPEPIIVQGAEKTFLFALNPTETTIYYDTSALGSTTARIYRAERAKIGDAFGTPVEVTALNDPSIHQGRATMDGRGLTLAFQGEKAGVHQVFVTYRSSQTQEFPAAVQPSLQTTAASQELVTLSFDGQTLYYLETVDGGGEVVRVSTRSGNDFPPGPPLPDFELGDWPPHVVADGTFAYFTRSSGAVRDVWRARRSTTGALTDRRVEPVINTADDEAVAFVSWDGCRLYFHRRARTTDAPSQIFMVRKPSGTR